MTERRLAGDQLAAAVRAPLPDRPRTTSLDPQSIAEFLAYDIAFETEPAFGVAFPPGSDPSAEDAGDG